MNNYLLWWVKAAVPSGLVAGLLAGAWHLMIGKDFATGFWGGVIGIGVAFIIIGFVGTLLLPKE